MHIIQQSMDTFKLKKNQSIPVKLNLWLCNQNSLQLFFQTTLYQNFWLQHLSIESVKSFLIVVLSLIPPF